MKIMIAGVVLLLVLGGIFLLSSHKKKTADTAKLPEYRQQADTFMNLMTSNKAEQSYAMLSAGMQAQNPYADWSNQIRESFGSKPVTPTFIASTQVASKHGYEKDVESQAYTISYSTTIKGNKWQTDLVIIKQDNKWQIDEMKSIRR